MLRMEPLRRLCPSGHDRCAVRLHAIWEERRAMLVASEDALFRQGRTVQCRGWVGASSCARLRLRL